MKFRLILIWLSIIILMMDNNYLFRIIKDNNYYYQLRLKVRKIKELTGMNEKYQFINSTKNRKIRENSPKLKNSIIKPEFLYDNKNLNMLIGKTRFGEMTRFFDFYRNSSNQSNIIFLGDIVHEFMYEFVDTLFVPFNGRKYCYKIEESKWCHITNLDLFIYPAIVQYNGKYSETINYNQYIKLKNKTSVTIQGNEGTLINLVIPKLDDRVGIYYLFGYMNEIFVSRNITININSE